MYIENYYEIVKKFKIYFNERTKSNYNKEDKPKFLDFIVYHYIKGDDITPMLKHTKEQTRVHLIQRINNEIFSYKKSSNIIQNLPSLWNVKIENYEDILRDILTQTKTSFNQ